MHNSFSIFMKIIKKTFNFNPILQHATFLSHKIPMKFVAVMEQSVSNSPTRTPALFLAAK